jgi:hypothetical protein
VAATAHLAKAIADPKQQAQQPLAFMNWQMKRLGEKKVLILKFKA